MVDGPIAWLDTNGRAFARLGGLEGPTGRGPRPCQGYAGVRKRWDETVVHGQASVHQETSDRVLEDVEAGLIQHIYHLSLTER